MLCFHRKELPNLDITNFAIMKIDITKGKIYMGLGSLNLMLL